MTINIKYKNIKLLINRTFSTIFLIILFVTYMSAQSSVSNDNQSWIDIKENVIIEYDPVSNKYIFYRMEGSQKSHPFKVMDKDEFEKYQIQNSVRNSWIEQRNTSAASQSGSGMNILGGTLRIDNNIFGSIFGGNEIVIIPQGSAEVIFTVNNTQTTNPMVAANYRSSTSFDFDTKLQVNVSGSIGERVKVDFNYNTEATFDFDTKFKVGYDGGEDDIIQKIEIGNVSFPLTGTLISGAQNLFGVRTDLKFGKLSVSGILSKQESESKTIEIKGGAQISDFEIRADEYDANRHFFLSQTFRDNYDRSLKNIPYIQSGINITRIEVWITNKTSNFDNSRSIAGFIDLGEPKVMYQATRFQKTNPPAFPANNANRLLEILDASSFRSVSDVTTYLNSNMMVSGNDYEKLENARKLIEGTDYVLNGQLGYISLNSALNNDEVLAVAYEYTANGISYKVGELSTDGIISPNVLVAKLLKGTNLTPALPTWKLMMKNIYTVSSISFSKDEFYLDVYYQNDEAGTDLTFLPEGAIKNTQLIRVLNLDNINSSQEAYPDGMFDFVENITVLSSRGRIMFPVLEPFGNYLKEKINNNAIASKYVFQELYDSTLVKARELAEKNKFSIKGSFKSEGSSEIMLSASNIPEGSVTVTVNGVKLVENVDYVVNYTMGTVNIINAAYLQSGMTLKVSLEDNSLFSLQQKTMYGVHLNYEIDKDFNIGATYLGLHERPMVRKVSYGEDPISNAMIGLNLSYRKEAPFLTKLVDNIPLLNTRESSYLTVDAEFAKLLAGQSSKSSYIDDFEASRATLDLRSFNAWTLASTPQKQPDIFPEGELSGDIDYGKNRAKFAWYSISTDLTRNTSYTPSYIRNNPEFRENHFVREIPVTEVYPDKEITTGTSEYISTLSMAFYPNERGPYNYDIANINPDGKFSNPEKRWGGIMRSLTVTDFETANYDHIEFWMMDPFVYNQNSSGGDLYINLGNISEDILRDGMKGFEHGQPYPFDSENVVETAWGRVPKIQSLVYTFDNNIQARPYQDIGFDGLINNDEKEFFESKYSFLSNLSWLNSAAFTQISNDPSSDNFRHYLDESYNQEEASILDRYKDFNGPDGNSQPSDLTGGQNRMATTYPDIEDLNRDNTMNESENYFQYRLKLNPATMIVGENFISDVREVTVNFKNSEGPKTVRWFQFKIPLNQYQKEIGDISDFKSIRFMRLFVRGFKETTYLRFASLDLVRSEWRRYNYSLLEGQEGLAQPELPNATFDVSVVNLEENSSRTPINYVMPPDVQRELNYDNYQSVQMNEQAMEFKIIDLGDGEGRAVYKNSLFDFRQFRRIRLDAHAEAIQGYPLNDNDITLFIRVGNDYRNNYYEYEIPLILTPYRTYSNNNEAHRLAVWPRENMLDVAMEDFTNLKLERNQQIKQYGGSISTLYEKIVGRNRIKIAGNPNLGSVKVIMIGVRNPKKTEGRINDDGLAKSAVVWVNEFRLADYENEGGWAATARATAQLADLGSLTLVGSVITNGFGSVEQRYADRAHEDTYEYSVMTNLELGKFFPEKWGVRIPFFFGYSAHHEMPLYNPFNQDVKLKTALDALSGYSRDSLEIMAKTYVQQKSFNLSNIRISPAGHEGQRVFDISNLSLSYAYTQQLKRNPRLVGNLQETYNALLSYAYNVQPKYWQPFKKLKPKSLAFFRDLGINPYPNQFSFTSEINRYYNEITTRNISMPEIEIPSTYSKDFTWERRYSVVYDITKNLRMDFSATNLARIDEPEGMVDKDRDPESYRHWRDSVWSNFWNFGRNINYNHQLQFTWRVPLNKIGILNWINPQISYRAGYEWVANMRTMEDYDPGNTISNTQTIDITAGTTLTSLYNKIKFLKQINDEFDGRTRAKVETTTVTYESKKIRFLEKRKHTVKHNLKTMNISVKAFDSNGKEIKGNIQVIDKNNIAVSFDKEYRDATVIVTGKVPKPQNPVSYTAKFLTRMLMSVKTVNFTYRQQGATTLPGFKGESKFLGMSNFNGNLSPGWKFILGDQSLDFVDAARQKHWLTTDTSFFNPYLMSQTRSFSYIARVEPIKDLNINITGQRQKMTSHVRYSVVDAGGLGTETGNFNISVISIGSAFENPTAENKYKSKSFEKFLSIRKDIAWKLANSRLKRAKSQIYDPGTGEYPVGYGEFSQEVLINSFLSAYANVSNSKFSDFIKIPLPNWNIQYTGLARLNSLKKYLSSATIVHSYSSIYSINSFSSNQLYDRQEDGLSYVKNVLNDFIAYREMTNVSIREAMNPLFKIDLSFKNMLLANFEISRTRTVALSLSNNQITEARTMQYVFGAGYMFQNFPQIFNFGSLAGPNQTTSLRLKGDFSLREDLNIIRKLDQSDIYSQIGDGRKVVSFTATADYAIGDKINIRLFFERQLNEPYVSSIATTNTSFGFSLRLVFAQ
ncbi:MAG: cell surface protein SprA [Prevotellaceae bacterium]|nr:cell surface protein SprA [Prevotellaceae bacterium]